MEDIEVFLTGIEFSYSGFDMSKRINVPFA